MRCDREWRLVRLARDRVRVRERRELVAGCDHRPAAVPVLLVEASRAGGRLLRPAGGFARPQAVHRVSREISNDRVRVPACVQPADPFPVPSRTQRRQGLAVAEAVVARRTSLRKR